MQRQFILAAGLESCQHRACPGPYPVATPSRKATDEDQQTDPANRDRRARAVCCTALLHIQPSGKDTLRATSQSTEAKNSSTTKLCKGLEALELSWSNICLT